MLIMNIKKENKENKEKKENIENKINESLILKLELNIIKFLLPLLLTLSIGFVYILNNSIKQELAELKKETKESIRETKESIRETKESIKETKESIKEINQKLDILIQNKISYNIKKNKIK